VRRKGEGVNEARLESEGDNGRRRDSRPLKKEFVECKKKSRDGFCFIRGASSAKTGKEKTKNKGGGGETIGAAFFIRHSGGAGVKKPVIRSAGLRQPRGEVK